MKKSAPSSSLGTGDTYDELKLDEYAAELICQLPREGDGFGLGVVVEYEHPTESEAQTLIADPFSSGVRANGSQHSIPWPSHFGERTMPASRMRRSIWRTARLMQCRRASHGQEAYGTVERIGSTGAKSDEAGRSAFQSAPSGRCCIDAGA
jgi:hypothetical protein